MDINMKPKNRNFFILGSFFFLLFLLTLLGETRLMFAKLDLIITTSLQAAMPRIIDVPLSLFTISGSFEVTGLIVTAVFFWLLRKQKIILWSLVLFGVIVMFEFIGKFLLYHPNPPHNFFRYELPFNLPTDYVRTNYSFPSGHEARTLFVVVLGMFFGNKFIKNKTRRLAALALLVIFAAVMAVSRIYLGAHWTSDVIGGIFLGASMALFTLVYY